MPESKPAPPPPPDLYTVQDKIVQIAVSEYTCPSGDGMQIIVALSAAGRIFRIESFANEWDDGWVEMCSPVAPLKGD